MDVMSTITLLPITVPPSAIARSMAKSLAVGLLAIALYLVGGWLEYLALLMGLYSLVGLVWYPWMERRLRNARIVFDERQIRWEDGSTTEYRDVLALRYRDNGRRLVLRATDGDRQIALQHYRLDGASDEHDFLVTLSKRVVRDNPEAEVDIPLV